MAWPGSPQGQEEPLALPQPQEALLPEDHSRLPAQAFSISTEMTETGPSPRPSWEDFLEVGAGGRAGLGSGGEFPGGRGELVIGSPVGGSVFTDS